MKDDVHVETNQIYLGIRTKSNILTLFNYVKCYLFPQTATQGSHMHLYITYQYSSLQFTFLESLQALLHLFLFGLIWGSSQHVGLKFLHLKFQVSLLVS